MFDPSIKGITETGVAENLECKDTFATLAAKQRVLSYGVNSQADLRLCCSHMGCFKIKKNGQNSKNIIKKPNFRIVSNITRYNIKIRTEYATYKILFSTFIPNKQDKNRLKRSFQWFKK